ncbi:hypothetical protein IV203_023748 [Nitzschia inconspicua]|uniref:Uncharacterized protein n=1 Tax=Nitzschia inconspicua TaxID=303405 RepID=A0A9K3KAS3_9STRA|nr:hypothetical protein IV203_023748 [Nitzschia inconspicua]
MESSNASKQTLAKVNSKWRVTSNWCSKANNPLLDLVTSQDGYCLYVQRPLPLLCREQIPKHVKLSKLAVDDFWGLPTNSKVLLIHYDVKRFHGLIGRSRKNRRHQHGNLSNDGEIKRKQGDCYIVDCVVSGSDQSPQMKHANNLDLAIFPSMTHRHSALLSQYSNTEAPADEI